MLEDEEEEDEGYNSYNSLATEKRGGKKLEREELTVHQNITQEELRKKFGLLKEAYDELRGEQNISSFNIEAVNLTPTDPQCPMLSALIRDNPEQGWHNEYRSLDY